MKLKDLKHGDYFTLKQIDEPKETQVYVRLAYDWVQKKYGCCKFTGTNITRYYPSDKEVYTDFIF